MSDKKRLIPQLEKISKPLGVLKQDDTAPGGWHYELVPCPDSIDVEMEYEGKRYRGKLYLVEEPQ